jgi:MinD superfamily P-loop ATPase
MHEVVVLSGKGGTGKTSLTAAFAHLAQDTVLCDLDVDAPDLHLIAAPAPRRSGPFLSGHVAVIDPETCNGCGECVGSCAFGAIRRTGAGHRVDPARCEGCGVCVRHCPQRAIEFPDRLCGTWYESETRFGPMLHALLDPGQENSGKLVVLLKAKARERAAQAGLDLILSDGAPGIGCPVISSLSQATLALLVTEPTPSGLHDLERVEELCRRFRTPRAVLVNKADLSLDYLSAIRSFCDSRGVPLAGLLPFDPAVVEAMVRGEAVTEDPTRPFGQAVGRAWTKVQDLLHSCPG